MLVPRSGEIINHNNLIFFTVFLREKIIGICYTQYTINMEYFNKSFFKFTIGFIGILILGIIGVLVVGGVSVAEEDDAMTAQSITE